MRTRWQGHASRVIRAYKTHRQNHSADDHIQEIRSDSPEVIVERASSQNITNKMRESHFGRVLELVECPRVVAIPCHRIHGLEEPRVPLDGRLRCLEHLTAWRTLLDGTVKQADVELNFVQKRLHGSVRGVRYLYDLRTEQSDIRAITNRSLSSNVLDCV